MMYESPYFALANNAALLLAMGAIYDALILSSRARIPYKPLIGGLALGLIAIAIMATPMMVDEGVIIDSRSVLLSATGLFFGSIPTAIAVICSVLFRLYEGGQGTLAGIVFILTSAGLGLLWRRLRKQSDQPLKWPELYLFGLVVHFSMLMVMGIFLPERIAYKVTTTVAYPLLLIYPVVTVLLCMGLGHQRQRKKTEKALRVSEAINRRTVDQLQTTLQAIPDQLFEIDIDGHYYDCRSIDYQDDLSRDGLLLSQHIEQIMPAEACATLLNALKEAEQNGHVHGTQITLAGKDGQRCFELSIARRHTLVGQSPRFVVLSRDISDRKKAEQELHIAATAFNSQEGMIITDTSHRILRVNDAFTQVTGYSAAEVIDKKPSILSSGRHEDDFYIKMMEELKAHKYWQGEIWNKRKNGEVYPEWLTITAVTDDHAQVTNYVAAFTDITQRKQAEADIHTLAFYDSLTGLPNRRLLLDRLEQSLLLRKRRHQLGALMFIDLDNFKTLNDTQGHDIGDCLLIEVAQRLRHSVREVDTVARLGGDEFIIILEDLNADYNQAALDAEQIAEKIVQTLNQPYPLKDYEYHGTASIGLSLFDHRDKNAKDLLKRADVAMYQAKESGRNTLRFFDPKIQQELYLQAEMESELRRAIADEQLVLYYQAQTYLGKITGAEVLLRWIHPEKGLIPPGKFIPLAEQCGLIIPLGNWVLETACRQLAAWADHPELSKVTLSVNVSAHQFSMIDFVANVERVLRETGAEGKLLKFELTESAVLIDVESTADKMMQLKDLGINFSIDDFGTGYSSLFHLKHLPVDQLKIDRSFVRDINEDPDDLAIVQAIIAMAHNLGISVIAEGVETEAQKLCLEKRQCRHFQGFLFSQPVPLDQFENCDIDIFNYETA